MLGAAKAYINFVIVSLQASVLKIPWNPFKFQKSFKVIEFSGWKSV